ncbi:MAG: site-specific integrase [Rhizobiaceae bacterium]|nr:site-specific integrase [Rhizobiaceae bacterium]
MFENLPHVIKRGKKFSIRVAVPIDVRSIVGKNEITRTLGTGDPIKAKAVYYEKLAELEELFSAARRNLKTDPPPLLTVEIANQLATAYFQRHFFDVEMEAHQTLHNRETTSEVTKLAVSETLLSIEQDMDDFYAKGSLYATGTADAVLSSNGFPLIVVTPNANAPRRRVKHLRKVVHVDRNSAGYKELIRLCSLGLIEAWQRMKMILLGEKFSPSDSVFPTVSFVVPSSIDTMPVSSIPNSDSAYSIRLGDLIKQFLEAHETKSDRWKVDIKASLRPLLEVVGKNVVANKLTKQNFRDVLNFVRRIPTNAKKGRDRKGKSLTEIVQMVEKVEGFEDDLLHPKTVNKYMGRVSQVMEWAFQEPLIDRNHAKGIHIPADEIEDDDASRKEFSPDQLAAIFSDDIFTNPKLKEQSIYWASLISLFHGMRSEEILQLRYDDFKEKEGISYFELHKRDGNHLKNKSARRDVPLHPYMFELGILSLVEMSRKRKDKRLFPDVERGSEGKFTSIFSRRYSRYLEGIGQKTKDTSFHSFRHRFRDAARDCEISDDRACAIGGWKFGTGTHTIYGSGLSLTEKLKAIKKLQYPNVDFSHITVIDWAD